MPSNYLRRNDDGMIDGAHGKVAIGITTDPELFMNAPIMKDPFKGDGVKHAICRTSQGVMEVKDGQISDHGANGGIITNGLLIDVWIESGKLKICKDSAWKIHLEQMCEINLLYDESGEMLEYFFAMAFTATQKKIVRFEISGDFV